MKKHALAFGAAAVLLTAAACSKGGGGAEGNRTQSQTPAAQKVAGTKTIAAGLAPNSKFVAAAKFAGLDQTLAGPGPYTVFVPDDAAFDTPEGTFEAKPENRAKVTSVLTNLILSGTVLMADLDKAIEQGKGKAPIATVGGETLTATKENGKIVLADSTGHKASISKGDEQFTNGVVHHVDALLMPGKAANAPTVGQKAGQ